MTPLTVLESAENWRSILRELADMVALENRGQVLRLVELSDEILDEVMTEIVVEELRRMNPDDVQAITDQLLGKHVRKH